MGTGRILSSAPWLRASATTTPPQFFLGPVVRRMTGSPKIVCLKCNALPEEFAVVKTASTMLPLGTPAPDFSLVNVDGRTITLSELPAAPATVIVFMCNHCPFVKHIAPELSRFADEYQARGVHVMGINSNDTSSHPQDSPEQMVHEAEAQGYRFPYLFDETQEVAQAYRAACTPDFFVFDGARKLVYRGQFDPSRPGSSVPVTGSDLRAAVDALLAGQPAPAAQRPSIGCNIKWRPGKEPDYFDPVGVK